jgi:hypothetical protein
MGRKRRNKKKNFTKEIMSAIVVILAMLFGYVSQNGEYLNNISTNEVTQNVIRNFKQYYRYKSNTRIFR